MPEACLWLCPPWPNNVFAVALTVCDLRAFLFHHSMLIWFDCLLVSLCGFYDIYLNYSMKVR